MTPGTVLGEYEIEALAGAGGMGAVYRARHVRRSERVAIKMLRYADPAGTRRLLGEARTLAALRHPGIVRFLEQVPGPAGELYIVMEWLEGESLARRLSRGPLTVEETVTLGVRVGEALGCAHRSGVMHRDVTPANVFLVDGRLESAKLIDFGLALRDAQTVDGVGTIGYLAPEQLVGASEIDARIDVFALGCVLFRCLTGHGPFGEGDPLVVCSKTLLDDAPRLREVMPVPEALERVVASMLAKAPDARPRDGAAVAAELDGLEMAERRAGGDTAVTMMERRLRCLVLSRNDDNVTRAAAELRDCVAALGARLEVLRDGILVTIDARGAAEQALIAGRCALALHARALGRIAILAARDDAAGHARVGESIDRTIAQLDASQDGGIFVDAVVANWLAPRFVLAHDADGAVRVVTERQRSDEPRLLLGRRAPFVGRQRELSSLRMLFDECVSERVARCAVVIGPPGAGKSRLRHELMRGLEERGDEVAVMVGGGDPLAAGAPFGLLASAIRSLVGLRDGEPIDVRRGRIIAHVGERVTPANASRVSEFVGELVGAPFADAQSVLLRTARADSTIMGDQVRRAIEELLRAECAVRPVLLILEDLHWGDAPSIQCIDRALRNLAHEPLMVFGLSRSEVEDRFPALWADRGVQEMRLGALPSKASEQLARAALGDTPGASHIAEVVAQAGGNPFYLEELIRLAAAGQEIDALPDSVLAVVQARLDALEVDARRLLRAASVFGSVFWRGGVLHLLGGDAVAAHVDRWMDELAKREVLTHRSDARFHGEKEYGFQHVIVRDAVYAMLTDADRTHAHRLAASWLAESGESNALALGTHFELGGDIESAMTCYRSAAEQSLEGNDYAATIEMAERAIRCGAARATLGALRQLQADASRWRGKFTDAEAFGVQAVEHLPRGSAGWHRATGELAFVSSKLGRTERLRTMTHGDLAEETDVAIAQIIAASRQSMQLALIGQQDLADELLRWIDAADGSPAMADPRVAARRLEAHAIRAMVRGDLGAAFDGMSAAAEQFEAVGDVRNASGQRSNAGYIMMNIGAFADAERALRSVVLAAEQLGLRHLAALANHNLGLTLARMGAVDEGARIERAAVDEFAQESELREEAAARTYLALILGLAERFDLGAEEARRAVELAEEMPPVRAYALAVLAAMNLSLGKAAESFEAVREAHDILAKLGTLDDGESFVRVTYARALDAVGRHDEACTEIVDARTVLLARAAQISDATWRASFLERVPESALTLELASRWVGA